jgi:hypothetical protein
LYRFAEWKFYQVFGTDNEDAIMLNGGSHVIRHGYEMLVTTYDAVRFLLDSNDDQELGGGLEIYNNVNSSSGVDPVHRFSADGALGSYFYGETFDRGKLGINTTNPQKALHVDGTFRIDDFTWYDFNPTSNFLKLRSEDNGLIGQWDSFTGVYFTLSDARLKYNINDISGALNMVSALQPKSYQFKAQNPGVPPSIGFIAQDVKEILPGAVTYDEEEGRYTMDYSAFGVLAIQAIKEQQTQIEQLTVLTEALLNRVESLEKEVSCIDENE